MVNPSPIYIDFLDFLLERADPEDVLAYQASEEQQERAFELLEKNNAGTLTVDEEMELARMQEINRLVKLLKVRAFETLQHKA
jgi:hypothetical protein